MEFTTSGNSTAKKEKMSDYHGQSNRKRLAKWIQRIQFKALI